MLTDYTDLSDWDW